MAEGIRDGAQHDVLRESESRFKCVFFAATWPAAIIISLREPFLQVLLQRGAFNAHSVHGTAEILPFFLVGMIAIASMNLIRNIYYALQSYWRTALIGIAIPLIYCGLAGVMVRALGIVGIGLAFACAYSALLAISLYWIPGTLCGLWSKGMALFILRTTLAGLVAGWLTARLNVLVMHHLWLPAAVVGCATVGSVVFWVLAFSGLPANVRARVRFTPHAETPSGA